MTWFSGLNKQVCGKKKVISAESYSTLIIWTISCPCETRGTAAIVLKACIPHPCSLLSSLHYILNIRTLLRVEGNMSADSINLMLKAAEHTKCWLLVWSLCSHSCSCLLFPVPNWQLDQHPHKRHFFKEDIPGWKSFLCCDVVRKRIILSLVDSCEYHVWPEARTLQVIMSQPEWPEGDADWVMGERGLQRSVGMTCEPLSQISG